MRQLRLAFWSLAIAAVAACSGGGSSTPSAPVPVYTGEGANEAINQKITFTIVVPAAQNGAAGARRRSAPSSERRGIASASPTPAPPYFSPATGAIVLTLAEINGVSPQVAPPAIPAIDVSCQACTFTVPNIPAALGTNRYFVQTYTGYANGAATGNLISSGFLDVTVPVTANPKLGGIPALSVGGYVARIELSPGTVNFDFGVAGDQNIFVTALDPGGATIIGSVQYVNPIVVTVSDPLNTALNGGGSVSVAGTLPKPIDLHYGGGLSFGSLVNAATTNENGAPVTAPPIEVNFVQPTPTPTLVPTPIPSGHTASPPTPTPAPTPRPSPTIPPSRLSLYVADASLDTVSEYAIVSQISANQVPNPIPTPKRVLQLNKAAIQAANPSLSCNQSQFNPGSGDGTIGVAVASNTLASNGEIFTLPTCYDGTNAYVFGFPANAVGTTTPTLSYPAATTTLFNTIAPPMALAYAPKSNDVLALFAGYVPGIAGWSVTAASGQQPSIAVGQQCYQEFTYPACSEETNSFNYNGVQGEGFSADPTGYAYIPAYWNDQPTNGDAANLVQPGALLPISPAGNTSLATTPQSALTGINSLLGASDTQPFATFSDGLTLYALAGAGNIDYVATSGLPEAYPGLSACPPPSANAPLNPPAYDANDNSINTNCEGGTTTNQHMYLVAYSIGFNLLGNNVNQTNVDLTPEFAIGGDTVGGFGCAGGNTIQINGGQLLAESAGYVYVLNEYPQCGTGETATFAPEIDIYNTNGVTGYHTDIPPVARINLASSFPSAIALGPTGSVIGGQAILRQLHRGYRRSLSHVPRRRPPYRW